MYLVNFAYKLGRPNYLFNTYIIVTKWASKNQGPFEDIFKIGSDLFDLFLSALLLPEGSFLSVLMGLELALGE